MQSSSSILTNRFGQHIAAIQTCMLLLWVFRMPPVHCRASGTVYLQTGAENRSMGVVARCLAGTCIQTTTLLSMSHYRACDLPGQACVGSITFLPSVRNATRDPTTNYNEELSSYPCKNEHILWHKTLEFADSRTWWIMEYSLAPKNVLKPDEVLYWHSVAGFETHAGQPDRRTF